MMRKPNRLLLTVIFIFCSALFTAATAQNIDSSLKHFSDRYETEKAYLHYDKPAYAAGETIWFKAYLVQGFFPAEGSKTFYVDWLDEKGTVLFHSVCPMIESSAIGQFDIPENYKGSVIHVRGYTRWMLNFDTAFLYEKDLRILSAKKTQTTNKKIITLAMMPEGGDAIEGVLNKIAFKATDQWGQPAKISGVIQSTSGELIDSINIKHDGMGFFYLMPQPGQQYTAHWKDENAVLHDTPLPAIQPDGLNLHVVNEKGKAYFTLSRKDNAADNFKEGYVIGTVQQHLIFKSAFTLQNSTDAKKSLPLEQFPASILTITAFDKTGKPVAERILFVNNNDYAFNSNIEVKHWGLSKRAKNEIEISIPDSMAANVSVAVTDAGIGADSSNNIYSGLLLTSDLKGNIYNPAQYFTANGEKLRQQLDLVMLTNGWRRFNWQDVVKGKFPALPYGRDTAYLSLSGMVSGIAPGASEGASLIMIVKQKDSASQIVFSPIEKDGHFKDANFIFFDTITVYHQFPKSPIYNKAGVQFMQERLPALFNNRINQYIKYDPLFTDTSGSSYNLKMAMDKMEASSFFKAKTLETVTVRAKAKTPVQAMDEKYASGLFGGGDGYSFDLVNDKMAGSYPDIFSYLQGKVAGLQINNSGGQVSMQWRGGTPQVYIDEMPTDVDMIQSLPVSDIAYVKVFRPPFMGGALGGAGGAIAIYMRKGGDFQNEPGKGLDRNSIAGYTAIRQFYSPNYSAIDRRNEQPDIRTTLYWDPMILTVPGKSKKIISFYNNDVTKAFRIIIEGINKDGQLTHFEQVLE